MTRVWGLSIGDWSIHEVRSFNRIDYPHLLSGISATFYEGQGGSLEHDVVFDAAADESSSSSSPNALWTESAGSTCG